MQQLPCRFLWTRWREKGVTSADLQNQTPHAESAGWETLPDTKTHTPPPPHRLTSDSEDRGGGSGGGAAAAAAEDKHSHSNTAERTPPDRWNVKIGLVCAFQRRAVRLGHMPTGATLRQTKGKKERGKIITNWQEKGPVVMVTHSTNSTLLTICDMCNPT